MIIKLSATLIFYFYASIPFVLIARYTFKNQNKISLWFTLPPSISLGVISFNIISFEIFRYFNDSNKSLLIYTILNTFIIALLLVVQKKYIIYYKVKICCLMLLGIIFLICYNTETAPTLFVWSSNEDLYDALTGYKQYLHLPFNQIHNDFKTHIKYQYSSLASISSITNTTDLYPIYIQLMTSFIISNTNLYWVSKYVFHLNKKIIILIVLSNCTFIFYINTIYSGHIGSTMYSMYNILYIGLIILYSQQIKNYLLLFFILVIRYYSEFTYIHVLFTIDLPLFLFFIHKFIFEKYQLYTKISDIFKTDKHPKKFLLISSILILLFLLITFLSHLYNSNQAKRDFEYNQILNGNVSWVIASYKEIIPIFWGLFQPELIGAKNYFPTLITNKIYYYFSFSLCLFLFYYYMKGCQHFSKNKNTHFLTIYALLFPLLAIFFRVAILSTYYFYKFLYVNYSLVLIIFICGAISIFQNNKIKTLRHIHLFIILCVFFINFFWSLFHLLDITNRPYNNHEQTNELIQFLKKNNVDSINNKTIYEDQYNAIKYQLESHQIQTDKKSSYILTPLSNEICFYDKRNTRETLFKNQNFLLFSEAQDNSNLILNPNIYQFQTLEKTSIFWYSPISIDFEPNNHNKIIQNFQFEISNKKPLPPYLNLIIIKGPSVIKQNKFELEIKIENQTHKYDLDNDINVINVPLESFSNINHFKTSISSKGLQPKSLMPFTSSYFTIGIAAIELGDSKQTPFIDHQKMIAKSLLDNLNGFNSSLLLIFTHLFQNQTEENAWLENQLSNNITVRQILGLYPIEYNTDKKTFRRMAKSATIELVQNQIFDSKAYISMKISPNSKTQTNQELFIKVNESELKLEIIDGNKTIKIPINFIQKKSKINLFSQHDKAFKIESITIY